MFKIIKKSTYRKMQYDLNTSDIKLTSLKFELKLAEFNFSLLKELCDLQDDKITSLEKLHQEYKAKNKSKNK